jgi:hypothetical protein
MPETAGEISKKPEVQRELERTTGEEKATRKSQSARDGQILVRYARAFTHRFRCPLSPARIEPNSDRHPACQSCSARSARRDAHRDSARNGKGNLSLRAWPYRGRLDAFHPEAHRASHCRARARCHRCVSDFRELVCGVNGTRSRFNHCGSRRANADEKFHRLDLYFGPTPISSR